jgi:lipopolysaccharide export system permease protein
MRLLDRYLCRSFLVPLAYCLASFCLIFVVYDLFDHLPRFVEARTPLALVARYYLLLLVPTFEYIAPASLLLATLYTLWHLGRNNEITAMLTSGVSFYRVLAPFAAVGFGFSLFNGALKETVASGAIEWTRAFARDVSRAPRATLKTNTFYYNVRDCRVWHIASFDPTQPARLKGVTISLERADGTPAKEIYAATAQWLDRRWWLADTKEQLFGANGQPVTGGLARAAVDADFLTEKPQDFAMEARSWELLSVRQMRRYLRKHPEMSPATRAWMRYDLHNRLAMPWACLVVTLFAVPAGAVGRRQNALTGVLIAVALFFAFYALHQGGLLLGRRQVFSSWIGAWLSNIVFLAGGLIMIVKRR